MNKGLSVYLFSEILPKYSGFDRGHSVEHILRVHEEILAIAEDFNLREDLCATIAMYHDLGLSGGRKDHEIRGAEIVRADTNLLEWFTADEIGIIADAVCDHRSSSNQKPRTTYGEAIAEADKDLNPLAILRRYAETTIAFIQNTPCLTWDKYDHNRRFEEVYKDLVEKYGRQDGVVLWLNTKRNVDNRSRLSSVLRDKEFTRQIYFSFLTY